MTLIHSKRRSTGSTTEESGTCAGPASPGQPRTRQEGTGNWHRRRRVVAPLIMFRGAATPVQPARSHHRGRVQPAAAALGARLRVPPAQADHPIVTVCRGPPGGGRRRTLRHGHVRARLCRRRAASASEDSGHSQRVITSNSSTACALPLTFTVPRSRASTRSPTAARVAPLMRIPVPSSRFCPSQGQDRIRAAKTSRRGRILSRGSEGRPKIARDTPAAASAVERRLVWAARRRWTRARSSGRGRPARAARAAPGSVSTGFVCGAQDRHPAVAELHHAVEGRRPVAADDDRRVRLLHRLGVGPDLVEVARTRRGNSASSLGPDLLHGEHALAQQPPAAS